MKLIETIKSWWSSLLPDPVVLDHVAIERKRKRDWRTAAVMKASQRHGKPFKAAMDGVPREVMRDGAFQVVGQESASVVQIKRRAK